MARNTYFQFKNFTIQQDQCAMKVCTDACLFGATIDLRQSNSVLDIGSGTGLLSLMLAQRFEHAKFTGVEIEHDAFEQSIRNVKDSPYGSRIQLIHSKIQDYNSASLFDVIITNPPFFQGDLKSPTVKKNQAHHAVTLDFGDLLASITRLLKPNGHFYILLPTSEAAVFQQFALNAKLNLVQNLMVRNNSSEKPFRQIMEFSREDLDSNLLDHKVLDIYEPESRAYTLAFKKLLQPYYLQF